MNRLTTRTYILLGIAVLCFIVALFPLRITRVENTPKEEAKYVRKIYGEHTVGQIFQHPHYTISALQIMVRAEQPHTITLIAHNQSGAEVGRASVAVSTQDQWITIPFAHSLQKGIDTIILTTDSPNQAVLVRFQPDSDGYSEGNMLVNNKESYGDIAFRVIQRLPAIQALFVWGQVNGTSTHKAIQYVLYALPIAIALLFISRFKKPWLALCPIFLFAIFLQYPYISSFNGVYGGDAFNYMGKANAILQGHDPFSADPRKGPFFSFLLLPGLFLPDPLLWSRWVGVITIALTASLVPLVAKRMGIPWALALMAGLLTASNNALIFEAPSGLAMPVFTLCILVSTYAYFRVADAKKWLYILAISSGITMLTRFEGALVGAVLLPIAWITYRISWKKMIWPIVIAFFIMAIPLSSFIWSGVSGIRTPQDISNDDGLFLVRSLFDKQLALNIQLSYEFFTNVWLYKGRGNVAVADWLGIGIVFGACIAIIKRYISKQASYVLLTLSILSACGFIFFLLMNNEINRIGLTCALYVLTGIGIALFTYKKPLPAIAVLLAIASQVAVIIWILPKGRYFIPTIPFLYLFLMYGIYSIVPNIKRMTQFFAILIASTALLFFVTDGRIALGKQVEEYNAKAQESDVLLKALINLRASKSIVGVESIGDDLAVRIYIPESSLVQCHTNQELECIRDNHIKFLLKRSDTKDWHITQTNPELFTLKTYTTKNGDAKVLVYEVK